MRPITVSLGGSGRESTLKKRLIIEKLNARALQTFFGPLSGCSGIFLLVH